MNSTINNKIISQNNNGTFIVLEAGPTHNGLKSAKKLADIAKESMADAIKFQLVDTDRLVADRNQKFAYKALKINKGKEEFYDVEEPLYDILKRRELNKSEWIELKKYCDSIDLSMFTTAMFNDEVDFIVDELGIDSVKIASSDVSELEFIKYCAKKNVNIQLDTGNADIWEIERAVIAAEEEGCNNIIIHHCPSGYPAHTESIHLNMIKTLKTLFPEYAIAYSDHSPGWEMDIAAVAIGADMIEKTITLDRTTRSCEHSFSLELESAKKFVKSIRDLEKALGSKRRVLPKIAREKRKGTRRSAHSINEITAGDTITKKDFEFKRPGSGISSEEFKLVIGKKLKNNLSSGQILKHENIR